MNFRRVLGWCMLLWLVPGVAWAGGTAHFVSEGTTVIVEFDGAGAMRIEEVGQTDAYMIMREGKLYSVASQDGNPIVIEMGGAMAMVQAMGGKSLFNHGAEEVISFRDTGRNETVAGLSGPVYEMTFFDEAGNRATETMVLSKDATVYDMTETMARMSEVLMAAMERPRTADNILMREDVLGKGYGILRYGHEFALSHIDSGQPSSERFDLPAAPMDLSAMSGFMRDGLGARELEEKSSEPSAIEKKTSKSIKKRASEEADRATDKAVDKVFKKLFGG